MSERDAGSSMLGTYEDFINEHEEDYAFLLDLWIKKQDFDGLANIMVAFDSQNCYIAGALAHRRKKDPDRAFRFWDTAIRALHALDEAVRLMSSSTADGGAAIPQEDCIRLTNLHFLVICLVLAGDRAGLMRVRRYLDLPIFTAFSAGGLAMESPAAETKLIYAAWAGDTRMAADLIHELRKIYVRFGLSTSYLELWEAVAARDGEKLNRLLPHAQAAYKKAGKRKGFDIYGGDRAYNENMIDGNTTVILKVAKDAGMRWNLPSAESSEIWPGDVIERWRS